MGNNIKLVQNVIESPKEVEEVNIVSLELGGPRRRNLPNRRRESNNSACLEIDCVTVLLHRRSVAPSSFGRLPTNCYDSKGTIGLQMFVRVRRSSLNCCNKTGISTYRGYLRCVSLHRGEWEMELPRRTRSSIKVSGAAIRVLVFRPFAERIQLVRSQ